MMLADQVNIALSQPKLPPGLRWVSDPYRLRDTIRKAKHFRLDAGGSRKVAEVSLAIAEHLDEARELSRSPYPTIWVDVDNVARLNRVKELGIRLTSRADGRNGEGGPVPSVGWLIERHATQHSAYRATYFTAVDEGVIMAPLSWVWDCEGHALPWAYADVPLPGSTGMPEKDFLFGIRGARCDAVAGVPGWVAPHREYEIDPNLLLEFTGELRHMFAFLVTINAVKAEYRDIPRIDGDLSQPPPVVKGKPVYPLVHRDIVIEVPKRLDLTRIVTRLCEGMRKRRHDVRGHWRHFYNTDGSLRRRVWIRDHERGDEKLGRILRQAPSGYQVHG